MRFPLQGMSHEVESLIKSLSPREWEVLQLWLNGETHVAIAESLDVGEKCISTFVGRIRVKYSKHGLKLTRTKGAGYGWGGKRPPRGKSLNALLP